MPSNVCEKANKQKYKHNDTNENLKQPTLFNTPSNP